MAEIQLERMPFVTKRETRVTITKGFQILKDEQRLPVVVKKHDCTHVKLKDAVDELNQRISEGLMQMRAEHPHACKLLDIRVHITEDLSISVSHVLEALDKNVQQAIDERKQVSQPYTEAELRTFLVHMAEALAYAHSKGIAHCDVKPENVFQTISGEYKVGDFGSFWAEKYMKSSDLQSQTDSGLSTPVFMSPQRKQSCQGEKVQYCPFKNDVYSLGASALNFASLDLPYFLSQVERLDEVVMQKVGRLHLSSELSALLRDMLSLQEDRRPTMQEVLHRLMSPPLGPAVSANPAPTVISGMTPPEESSRLASAVQLKELDPTRQSSIQALARFTFASLQLFNFQSSSWKAAVFFDKHIKCDEGSTYVFVDEARICVCGSVWERTGSGGEAYIISLEGRVQELPSMKEKRWGAGLVADNGDVFAFGGCYAYDDGYVYDYHSIYYPWAYDNCITLNLSTPLAWAVQQGQMSEHKMGFAPCVLLSKAYLCGLQAIDVFDLSTRRFRDPLRVTFQREDFLDRVAFVVQNELVVISRERTTRINLSTLSTRQEQHEMMGIAPGSSVVMAEGSVYWVSCDNCMRATSQQPTHLPCRKLPFVRSSKLRSVCCGKAALKQELYIFLLKRSALRLETG